MKVAAKANLHDKARRRVSTVSHGRQRTASSKQIAATYECALGSNNNISNNNKAQQTKKQKWKQSNKNNN